MNSTNTHVAEQNRYEREIVPAVDIYENETGFVVTVDMPAVSKENVAVTLHENTLDIRGTVTADEKERESLRYGEYALYNYHRTFTVGDDIDPNGVSAKIENGVLTLTLAKREEVKPKKIEIAVH
ncbi:MAG TPA: Hsp20/alpha crystallin family protein [Spirochaetota bacterium]|nr:Hsp20/alpha crystallin family protein [Spirochaetota bacterium]HNT09844.1 Hsp20/alpha crystallin family protein [Spirochaetota bacterium]HNV46310.1 Hsp20/alpha crystallin family protein [Spirochaetota bacterium]HOS38108.1 Hsp20/alpha crystallin family protein [Spirochaetota bacterium]HPI22046.1 Hsp20/alpha crystallin family protein [Spirochaetota bacterium]